MLDLLFVWIGVFPYKGLDGLVVKLFGRYRDKDSILKRSEIDFFQRLLFRVLGGDCLDLQEGGLLLVILWILIDNSPHFIM